MVHQLSFSKKNKQQKRRKLFENSLYVSKSVMVLDPDPFFSGLNLDPYPYQMKLIQSPALPPYYISPGSGSIFFRADPRSVSISK